MQWDKTLRHIRKKVAEEHGIPEAEVTLIVELFFKNMKKAIAERKYVLVENIGKFYMSHAKIRNRIVSLIRLKRTIGKVDKFQEKFDTLWQAKKDAAVSNPRKGKYLKKLKKRATSGQEDGKG